MIPKNIKIQNKFLPEKPGVYIYKNAKGKTIYVGKATSLKRRVGSYWVGAKDAKTTELLRHIRAIDYIVCGSVLEALVVEANLIRRFQPKYNILEKDDKSFLYVAFPRRDFSRPELLRGFELARLLKKKFIATFGPFLSGAALRAALEILRKIFPYSTCEPNQKRPCFDFHIGKCPGVCVGLADKKIYNDNIKNLIRFFKGESAGIIRNAKQRMAEAASREQYEAAAMYRNRAYALKHIRDISVLTRENPMSEFVDIFGRVEGYDISNIGGNHAVGSMVVFADGAPKKSEYKIFNIKTVVGANDTAMLAEVLGRRGAHADWPMPDLLLIDGGRGQINAARRGLGSHFAKVPIVGIAKGITRKKDELIPFDPADWELKRLIESHKTLLVRVRDEAHRFAISHYRKRHRKKLVGG